MAADAFDHTSTQMSTHWWHQSSDLFLAVVIVAIVALMILPLPLVILDTLLAINISLGIVLVLMAIYVSSPLQFSAFPSVLLISTLFRLALSVATTRMILLNGDAGNIVETFGDLVAGGNVVVGMVVFLIITLVQFLVIAKGAERVAEVGARFTLDAMPGKQMSIDSDLRSGLIGKIEARRKREELELESKLHGSMDGAMKFVKGDAIAGIIIILVNLIGGLTIGIYQLDMAPATAMSRYSILTIGDGMVAQIPALFGAMSAGLIVTRVVGNDSSEHLGSSIQKQLTSIPRVLLLAGAVCWLFAWVPGFPTAIFLLLGLVLIGLGVTLVPVWRKRIERNVRPSFKHVLRSKNTELKSMEISAQSQSLEHSVPLSLTLPVSLATAGNEQLHTRVSDVLASYQRRMGFRLPRATFEWSDATTDQWMMSVFEVPVATGTLDSASATTSLTLTDQLIIGLDAALLEHGYLFLGMQETSNLMNSTSTDYPDIVKESLRSIPMQNIAAIFRNLVQEGISIRNLRDILEALINAAVHEKDHNNLTEIARISLAREICHRHTREGVMRAVSLSTEIEQQLEVALRSSAGTQQLSLDPVMTEKIRSELCKAILHHAPDVIMTKVQIRRHCRDLLGSTAVTTPVLSYNELLPTVELQVLQRVAVPVRPRTTTVLDGAAA